jgi:hypothetical protein
MPRAKNLDSALLLEHHCKQQHWRFAPQIRLVPCMEALWALLLVKVWGLVAAIRIVAVL